MAGSERKARSAKAKTPLTFARVVTFLGGLPLLLLSIAVILLTLVDRFEILGVSVYPTLPVTATSSDEVLYSFLKIVVLLVSLSSAAIAADRLSHFSRVETELARLADAFSGLEAASEVRTTPLPDRASVYRAFLEAVSSAPHGSTVCVTSYEKLKMSYETGEDNGEVALLSLYDKRVRAQELRVEQLVHVSTKLDLDDAWKRASSFENSPNFTLSVVVGIAPDPMIETLTVGEDFSVLGLSTQAASPFAVDGGHSSRSTEIVRQYRQHHRLWESRFGIPLKSRDGLVRENFDRLSRELPPGHALDLPPQLASLALRAQRDDRIFSEIARIVESRERVEAEGEQVSLDRIHELIRAAGARIEEVGAGRLTFSGDGFRYLHRALTAATTEIRIVSLANSIDFWKTEAAVGILRSLHVAKESGVSIVRAFIGSESEMEAPEVRASIDKEVQDGTSVLLLVNRGGLDYLARDFILIDDRVAFEDVTRAAHANSRMVMRDGLVAEYRETFQTIWQLATSLT